MKNRIAALTGFLCIAVGAMTACSGVTGQLQDNSIPSSTQLPSQSAKENGLQTKLRIRQVDFGNFSYPKLPTGKCSMEAVHLKGGKYEAPETIPRKVPSIDCWSVTLGTVDYGDVTGDGTEEAIVILYAERGGTESSQDVYVYSSRGEEPALLWKFATGDRADGGRRRISAENGELVVELFGVGTAIGKELYGTEDVPDCCPEHYTRARSTSGWKTIFSNTDQKKSYQTLAAMLFPYRRLLRQAMEPSVTSFARRSSGAGRLPI